MIKYENKRSTHLRGLATKVLKERDDLQEIRSAKPKIAYVTSQQEKKTGNGTRMVLGECKKVPGAIQWCCPYDFVITIYTSNCIDFDTEKYKILLWHELKHKGIKPDVIGEDMFFTKPHDYEEFKEIVEAYGIDWVRPDAERKPSQFEKKSCE